MSPLKRSNNIAARMGRWSATHRKKAIFGWLAFVVLSIAIGMVVGTKQIDHNNSNVGEAHRADQMLLDAGFQIDPQTEFVIIQSKAKTIDDPAFRQVVGDTIAAVRPHRAVFTDLKSPLDPAHADQVSKDRHTALVEFTMKGTEEQATKVIDPVVKSTDAVQAKHRGFYVSQAGSISTGKALDKLFNSQLASAGERSIPLTLIILVLVFGAVVAAGIPLLLALTAVFATIGLLALPSQVIAMDQNVSAVVLLIGLAVGVDYSLFYLKREREERAAGRGAEAALEAAAATSGRSVLISGFTVMVAMAGMFFSGDKGFMSFAVATMTVVAIAMLGSLTVLPAVLSKLGDRVEKGRIPYLHRLRRSDGGENRVWSAILTPAMRRPLASALLAATALAALAFPVLGVHTAISGLDSLPDSTKEVRAIHAVQDAFPGGPQPAVVVIRADDVRSAPVASAISELRREALGSRQMLTPIEVDRNADNTVARVTVPLVGKGTDGTSNAALATLRDKILPSTVGKVDGAEYAVTGITAASYDFNSKMKSALPYVFGFVLAFAFLLLLVSFRSVVIAAKAIVLNLLSVAAAYGVLVLVFQDGWGEGILNFKSNGGIASWLPLFMFVILFGLSMDYHVFILSRIREAYDRGLETEAAVEHGIKTTAGVVTSAAVVMVGAFAIFATMPILDMKEMGIGLAAAVLIDATIVRAVLLPATMRLLGDWNWYLPKWLDWLPRLEHEPEIRREAEPEPVPAAA
ncbi:MAG TPA: MMPL family transporter [Gaiellaceae bacterium]|nr:MMPL family transporter [Gaiellaceae bacterium]